jgi:S-adenosyl methyltransferase
LAAHRVPKEINTSVAHPARRYDYWLGGKDHFAADKESGDAVAAAFPGVRTATTRSCWCTPVRCCPALRRASPPTWTPTCDPDKILEHPDLHATLDLSRPVALVVAAARCTSCSTPTGPTRRSIGAWRRRRQAVTW